MIVDYCDEQDDKGNCCNRTPEYILKQQDGADLYLCKNCLYSLETNEEDKVYCYAPLK